MFKGTVLDPSLDDAPVFIEGDQILAERRASIAVDPSSETIIGDELTVPNDERLIH